MVLGSLNLTLRDLRYVYYKILMCCCMFCFRSYHKSKKGWRFTAEYTTFSSHCYFQVNALNEEFSFDCKEAFIELRDNPEVKSMVFMSAKPDCFIAGADIKMLSACETKEEIMELSKGKFVKLSFLILFHPRFDCWSLIGWLDWIRTVPQVNK